MITTDGNFSFFRNGEDFDYYGGHFKSFPAFITAPHSGYWNITIDPGLGSASIRYGLSKIAA
jgi:hypothetical protein